MAWTEPTTSNTAETKVTVTTFDEIAANQVYLKERADTVDDNLGQELNTDSDVTFNSVTTDNVAIKHKYFSGTLDSSGDATITHLLTLSNIIDIRVSVLYDSEWRPIESVSGSSVWDSNYMYIRSTSSLLYESSYKALITYQA